MPKPPNCSVVLSLDESIRRHIGFLLKATEHTRRIDRSARHSGAAARGGAESSVHLLFCHFFRHSPGAARDIKAKDRDQTVDKTSLTRKWEWT